MHINHVLVRTTNLTAMTAFWTDVIGLELGDRPPFRSPGAWLYSNGQPLIHIIEVDQVNADGSFDHVALEGADYQALTSRLEQRGADFRETSVPATGARQVFVAGPDQLKVELLFPNPQH
ncbi:VOC family protein [Microbulbifer hainanensis]|uniref:VOC family protein n=1 Tax=Microbulbifer hainanensis TaxID=2735675 RepID=UPI001867F8A3|nr:VOC family protein [Microbulbifer hainanensis]